jgi:PTH1 family peptidyl-tRNA hydrolase
MWIVVGLGNPGAEYAHSRHNVGFMVVERVAQRWNVGLQPTGALRVGGGSIAGHAVRLVEPQMFMNRSGAALAQLALAADDTFMVVHDDLDLPLGQLRVRRSGGSAGHRGIASIVERFGPEFVRVRVGIGRPAESDEVSEFVLRAQTASELAALQDDVERAADAVECVIAHGPETAMNRFNVRLDVPEI